MDVEEDIETLDSRNKLEDNKLEGFTLTGALLGDKVRGCVPGDCNCNLVCRLKWNSPELR